MQEFYEAALIGLTSAVTLKFLNAPKELLFLGSYKGLISPEHFIRSLSFIWIEHLLFAILNLFAFIIKLFIFISTVFFV